MASTGDIQPVVQPVATVATAASNPNGTTPALEPVAALRQARGRELPNRELRQTDNPPQNACRQHWKFGKQAYYCRGTRSNPCPWWKYCLPPDD